MRVAQTFQPGMLGLVTGIIVIGLALVFLTLRDRIGLWATTHFPTSHPQLAIAQLYVRMVHTVERRGVSKPPFATASEFVRLVQQEWKEAGPIVATITALYHQGRFSRTPLTPDELARAAEQVGKLQSLVPAARPQL